jgi:hypothetical protein
VKRGRKAEKEILKTQPKTSSEKKRDNKSPA